MKLSSRALNSRKKGLKTLGFVMRPSFNVQLTRTTRQSGLSLVEVLITVLIIAAVAVPVTDALRGAISVTEQDSLATINHYRLTGKMEEVLAQPFSVVAAAAIEPVAPTNFSDPLGTTDRRIVYIHSYDGDNHDKDNDPFTGTDSGLLWISVEIENRVNSIQALKADL